MADNDLVPGSDPKPNPKLHSTAPASNDQHASEVGHTPPASATPGAVLRVGDDVVRLATPIAQAAHRLADAGDLVRLVPPDHLAEGLSSGTLRYMQGAAGDKAIIVHREGGQIAGHANVERVGAATAQAALAFQVMAAVTQQYYLHQISGQLEAIDNRTRSIEDRQQTEALGDLLGIEREVHDLRNRRLRGL